MRTPLALSFADAWLKNFREARRDRAEIAPRSRRDRAEIAPRSRHVSAAQALAARVAWHYSMQLLRSTYNLIGSLDVLGNPSSAFADVSGGACRALAALTLDLGA